MDAAAVLGALVPSAKVRSFSTSTPREMTSERAALASFPRSLSPGTTPPSMELRPMTSSSIKVSDWCRRSRRRWCTSRGGAADGQGVSP